MTTGDNTLSTEVNVVPLSHISKYDILYPYLILMNDFKI